MRGIRRLCVSTMGAMSDSARRGRPPLTSREEIVQAVLDIGLDAATTSAVAERVGVDQSTLYRHIDSREDMLDAAVALAVSRTRWPEPGDDWAEYLRACARVMWGMFESTPGLAQRMRSMTTIPEELVRQSYRIVERLMTLDFTLREAALIVDTIGDMTADSFLTVELLDRPVPGGDSYRDSVLAAMGDVGSSEPSLAAEYHEVMRYAMGEPGRPSAWWQDKIDLVIDGVAHRLAVRRRD